MRAVRGETWVALGVIAFGAFLLIQTAAIEVSPGYSRVGPRVFPWVISGVLVALGLALLGNAIAGRWRDDEAAAAVAELFSASAFLWLAFGLALYLAAIAPAGFPVATALLFACAARAFGGRTPILDLAIGLVLGIAVYVGFHHGLGLTLTAGVLSWVL